MSPLRHRWGVFLSLVLDPIVSIFLAITVILVVAAANQTDKSVAAILAALGALSSGVLGSKVTDQWRELTEGRILVARGKVAIRNLKLLLRYIVAVEARARAHFQRIQEMENLDCEIVKTYFEDISDRCLLLQEATINSIENWTDIIPEADVQTQIGVISELNTIIAGLKHEIGEIQEELSQTKNQSEEERIRLEGEIKIKERQIAKAEKELKKQEAKVLGTSVRTERSSPSDVSAVISGYPGFQSSVSSFITGTSERSCKKCGNKYTALTVLDNGECSSCQLTINLRERACKKCGKRFSPVTFLEDTCDQCRWTVSLGER